MRILGVAVAALALASPVAAQHDQHAMHHGAAIDGVRALYEQVRGWIVAAAEQMPEEHYSFQPTPEVRTFGQLVGHVANASYAFCSSALGGERPQTGNAEQLTSKAELTAALRDAFAYCDRAYAITEMQAMEPATVFGSERSKLYALEFNMGHDFEHYGNMVTYMRIKGLVPPSSQGS